MCVNGESDFIEEYGLEDQGREWKRPRATIDRLEKERAARGPAAEKAASQLAQLEERIALDAHPCMAPPSKHLAKVEELTLPCPYPYPYP